MVVETTEALRTPTRFPVPGLDFGTVGLWEAIADESSASAPYALLQEAVLPLQPHICTQFCDNAARTEHRLTAIVRASRQFLIEELGAIAKAR